MWRRWQQVSIPTVATPSAQGGVAVIFGLHQSGRTTGSGLPTHDWVSRLIGLNLTYCFSLAGAPLIDSLHLFMLIDLILLLILRLILRQLDLA